MSLFENYEQDSRELEEWLGDVGLSVPEHFDIANWTGAWGAFFSYREAMSEEIA